MKDSIRVEKLELPSTLKNVTKLEDFIENIFLYNNYISLSHGNILIPIVEAFNNAVLHGNKLDETKTVSISMEITDDFIVFSISDQGNGFEHNNIPDPTLPSNLERINGRGIYLMKCLTDSVVFDNYGSQVHLKFNLK
jgi:serine/threonine-protein kinase RsbW